METDIRRLAARATKLRDAVLHSEATCPKVKSTIETDTDDITVVTAHTRTCVSRENTYIYISVLYNSYVACTRERSEGPNAQSFRPFREDIPGARVSMEERES